MIHGRVTTLLGAGFFAPFTTRKTGTLNHLLAKAASILILRDAKRLH